MPCSGWPWGLFPRGRRRSPEISWARLSDGMLVLADRGFFSFGLWNEARATGAELLWRTKAGHILPVDQRLGDGSYLSHLHERR